MLNIRKPKVVITIFIAFILTGCAHFTQFNKLPIDTAKNLTEQIGDDFNFGHLVIMDANTGESVFLKRTEKLVDGSPRYESKPISGPLPAKKVKDISHYSIIGSTFIENDDSDLPQCKNIGHSSCNIVTINNKTEIICNENEEIVSGKMQNRGENLSNDSDHYQGASTRIINAIKAMTEIPEEIKKQFKIIVSIPEIISLPKKLAQQLEELGGGKVKEVGFLVVQDIYNGEMKLLKSEGYKTVNNNLLDCVGELTSSDSRVSITYENSCCSTISGGGDGYQTCDRRC